MTNHDILICQAFDRLLSTPSTEFEAKLGSQIPLTIAKYIAELPPEEIFDSSVMANRISEFCERPENEALDDWFLDIFNSLAKDDIQTLVKKTGDPGDEADAPIKSQTPNEVRDAGVSLAKWSLEILKNEGSNQPATSNLILNLENLIDSLKLVVINLGEGNWEKGFSVAAQIWNDGHLLPSSTTGKLPPQAELPEIYNQWRETYQTLTNCIFPYRLEAKKNQKTNFNREEIKKELRELATQISTCLNNSLKSEKFRPISDKIRTEFSRDEELRIIIQSADIQLRAFPWHLWNLLEDYPLAEVAFSASNADKQYEKFAAEKARILVVLGQPKTGSGQKINLDTDQQVIENLTDAETVFLTEPTRSELDKALWQETGWQIFCFSGHSSSTGDGSEGWIEINEKETLSLADFKNALKAAISRGLQLAIFNSCDGLGLAKQLADLHLPQIIVMRERVPDEVAQEFLKNFFDAFAKQGKSLYVSVREAREKLQSKEGDFPCATWLPVICQNPATLPLSWQQLNGKNR